MFPVSSNEHYAHRGSGDPHRCLWVVSGFSITFVAVLAQVAIELALTSCVSQNHTAGLCTLNPRRLIAFTKGPSGLCGG